MACALVLSSFSFAQVAINNNGTAADESAALDITSTTRGLLIPRLTTAERLAIDSPANGLIIFDTDTKGLWFYETISAGWTQIYGSNNNTTLADADGNTKVEVEQTPDENTISLTMNGTEFFVFDSARIEVLNSGYSVFIGENAGKRDDYSDNFNVAIGAYSLSSSISSYSNTAIGEASMRKNTSGDLNVAVGKSTLYDNISGDYNTAIGGQALAFNTTGTKNVAIGMDALFFNITGDANLAVGYGALEYNKGNSRSTAIGFQAMFYADDRTTGRDTYNTALGYEALRGSTTASSNTGRYNTAIGDASLKSNANGNSNVAVGASSLEDNISGTSNSALGVSALSSNTTGHYNVAIGSLALTNNTSGLSNLAMGYSAMYTNVDGDYNTALGIGSLRSFTNSSANTAIGRESGYSLVTGSNNTVAGTESLYSLITGNNNTALGQGCLPDITSGDDNVAVGVGAGLSLTSGSDNIFIGNLTVPGVTTGSNQLNIGNTIYGTGIYQTTYKIGIGTSAPEEELDIRGELQVKNSAGLGKIIIDGTSGNSSLEFRNSGAYGGAFGYNSTNDNLFLYHGGNVVLKNGQFGVGTTTPGYTLQVGNSGDGSSARANAWNTFSDRRWKTNMEVIDHPIEKLNMLNGYYYNWKSGEDPSVQVGVIAQEVELALPEIVSTDSAGYKSVDYSKITALLIEVNKAQQKQIDELVKTVEIQNEKINQLLKIKTE